MASGVGGHRVELFDEALTPAGNLESADGSLDLGGVATSEAVGIVGPEIVAAGDAQELIEGPIVEIELQQSGQGAQFGRAIEGLARLEGDGDAEAGEDFDHKFADGLRRAEDQGDLAGAGQTVDQEALDACADEFDLADLACGGEDLDAGGGGGGRFQFKLRAGRLAVPGICE